jgi:hypothetical protein
VVVLVAFLERGGVLAPAGGALEDSSEWEEETLGFWSGSACEHGLALVEYGFGDDGFVVAWIVFAMREHDAHVERIFDDAFDEGLRNLCV